VGTEPQPPEDLGNGIAGEGDGLDSGAAGEAPVSEEEAVEELF